MPKECPRGLKVTRTEVDPRGDVKKQSPASATEAYASKLVGLEQGPLEKRITIPLGYPVLAWSVHDGDVYAQVAPG